MYRSISPARAVSILYNLNARSLAVLLNSAGSIHVSGTVDSQIIELNGLGSYDAADLQSRSTTILAGRGWQC
jgi:hypothetical protein